MSKIEKYLGIANHDIQVANNSNELKSYVASILCEIDELQQENQELKKQLENKYSKTGILTNEVLYEENTKLINQQKEFIKWLEDYLNLFDYMNIEEQADYDMLEEILQKYKEIIGGKDER